MPDSDEQPDDREFRGDLCAGSVWLASLYLAFCLVALFVPREPWYRLAVVGSLASAAVASCALEVATARRSSCPWVPLTLRGRLPFHVFGSLFAAAFVLPLAESWRHPTLQVQAWALFWSISLAGLVVVHLRDHHLATAEPTPALFRSLAYLPEITFGLLIAASWVAIIWGELRR